MGQSELHDPGSRLKDTPFRTRTSQYRGILAVSQACERWQRRRAASITSIPATFTDLMSPTSSSARRCTPIPRTSSSSRKWVRGAARLAHSAMSHAELTQAVHDNPRNLGTGRLERQDSNLGMAESKSAGFPNEIKDRSEKNGKTKPLCDQWVSRSFRIALTRVRWSKVAFAPKQT